MKKRSYILALFLTAGCSSPYVRDTARPDINEASKIKECLHTETSFNCVKVVEVYDGDTIFIDLPSQHPLFGKRMGVRIVGIDTPELRTKDSCEKKKGLEARAFLQKALDSANRIDIVDLQKDKYFRILGSVITDGQPVADELIKRKLAYPYDGKKKIPRNWCY